MNVGFAKSAQLRAEEPHKADAIAVGIVLGALVAIAFRLAPEWWRNPDLSHGWLTPVVFIILIQESRRHTGRFHPDNLGWLALTVTCCLGALACLGFAGLYAAALEWTHAVVESLLAAAITLLLAAAWIECASTRVRWVPLNWPAFVAVVSWSLSAPIPPGTYTRLTLALQDRVTGAVLGSLHWLGIAAQRDGNVINLAHASVGVEEACSGIRSLISCFFAGLFISATLCRRATTRTLIVIAAPILAIAMNFLRSLTLTLLADNGVDIAGFWHDVTGYAILLVTAALLAILALVLRRLAPARGPAAHDPARVRATRTSYSISGYLTASTAALVLALLTFFAVKTASAPSQAAAAPQLEALLPAEFPGWDVTTRGDLHRFSSQLQTDALLERTYARATPAGPVQITVYVAYWPAGQTSVSLVAAHTPEACWPGTGWVENRSVQATLPLPVGLLTLPAAEYRFFQFGRFPQHVWYWQLYGGKVIYPGSAVSPRALLRLAWHYGFRKDEPQLFVRVSSNRPWGEIDTEPLIAELFRRLGKIGL